jgi:ankyrin repeat protein
MMALLNSFAADTIAAGAAIPCSFRDAARAVLLWFIATLLHHVTMASILLFGGCCDAVNGDDDDETLRHRSTRSTSTCCSILSSFSDACCPRRRARFYKCAAAAAAARRRCHSSQHQQEEEPVNQDCDEEIQEPPQVHKTCCLSLESAAFFAKLHLPPPLPWRKRNKRSLASSKSSSSYHAKDSTCDEDTTKSSSSGDTIVHQDEGASSSKMKIQEQAMDHAVLCGEENHQRQLKQMPSSKISRARTSSATALIDLARMQHWDTILQQCAAGLIRKRDIRHRDADGLNTLHWACAGAPPETVVQALLQISPSVAHKTDNEGSTALHFATHYSASLAVVQTLLKAHPLAIRAQDRHGRSPLYHAAEKRAGIDVLQALIQADPSMVTVPCLPLHVRQEDETTTTTTHLGPTVVTRPVAARTPLFLVWSQVVLDRKARQSKRGRLWDKAQLLLEAAVRHHHDYTTNIGTMPTPFYEYRFLSAAIAMDIYLPDQVVSMAIESHPQQLRIPDETTGQLPLAQAVASRQYCMKRSRNMLKELLDAYPAAAAVCDRMGRTPLLLAAQAGKPWSLFTRGGGGTLDGGGILKRLFDANPDALLQRSPQSIAIVVAAAAASTGDIMKDPKQGVDSNNNDPFGLMTAKHHEWIQRRQMSLALNADDDEDQAMNTTTDGTEGVVSNVEQLETVFQLIRADPSIITKCL